MNNLYNHSIEWHKFDPPNLFNTSPLRHFCKYPPTSIYYHHPPNYQCQVDFRPPLFIRPPYNLRGESMVEREYFEGKRYFSWNWAFFGHIFWMHFQEKLPVQGNLLRAAWKNELFMRNCHSVSLDWTEYCLLDCSGHDVTKHNSGKSILHNLLHIL